MYLLDVINYYHHNRILSTRVIFRNFNLPNGFAKIQPKIVVIMFRKSSASLLYASARLLHVQVSKSILKPSYLTRKLLSKNSPDKIVSCCNIARHKNYCTSSDNPDDQSKETTKLQSGVSGKYKVFSDFDSPVILDVDEERKLRLEHPELFEVEEQTENEFVGLNLERGVEGVFDIEELVDVLKREKAIDLCVINIPNEYQYVDYMVIVSGKSLKHLKAMAEFIKKLYKKKKSEQDYFPIIEGKNSTDWMAMDLGNIALHFQTKECRSKYDVEMLWAIGPQYDDKINQKEDEYITLLKQHSALADLEPLDFRSPEQKQSTEPKNELTDALV